MLHTSPPLFEADAVEKREMQEPSDAEAPKVGIWPSLAQFCYIEMLWHTKMIRQVCQVEETPQRRDAQGKGDRLPGGWMHWTIAVEGEQQPNNAK